jgi:hypothetical protein
MQVFPAKRKKRIANGALLFAAIIGSLGISGCAMQSSSANGGGPPPAPMVPAAQIVLCDDLSSSCTAATSFSFSTLRDLNIQVQWTNVPAGNHVQQLDILLPNQGGLYQTTQTAFLISGSSPGSITTSRMFPVGGTWISQRQMSGSWSVQVSLDGQVMASQAVEFNP